MRTRDEVLIARFMRNETFTLEEGEDLRDAVRGMADDLMVTERQRDEYHALWKQETLAKRELADRLRELESQQASSEPVAWASYHDGCDRPWTVDLVKREPWGVSAGTRIVPLYAHPSAAAVRVTDAMVERFSLAYRICEETYERTFTHNMGIKAGLTAALTAESEGASE